MITDSDLNANLWRISVEPSREQSFTNTSCFSAGRSRASITLKNLLEGRKTPRVFIVHGRDASTLAELQHFLRNWLTIPNATVLADQRSKGRTVIEKFEHYAHNVDLVFVLATPDDFGRLSWEPGQKEQVSGRQNAVFELGFFLGALKRASGRVVLFHKGPLELRSDIVGVVYIDIGRGFEAAEAEIRREVAEWID